MNDTCAKLPVRLLYVDDDSDTTAVMSVLFSTAFPSLVVDLANCGRTALSMASESPYDLFVLDTVLPDISGPEVCMRLRNSYPMVPIIFYSAMSLQQDHLAAEAAGCSAYLVKPNDMDLLLERISKILGLHVSTLISTERSGENVARSAG